MSTSFGLQDQQGGLEWGGVQVSVHEMSAYADSDHATCLDGRRSGSGGGHSTGGGVKPPSAKFGFVGGGSSPSAKSGFVGGEVGVSLFGVPPPGCNSRPPRSEGLVEGGSTPATLLSTFITAMSKF